MNTIVFFYAHQYNYLLYTLCLRLVNKIKLQRNSSRQVAETGQHGGRAKNAVFHSVYTDKIDLVILVRCPRISDRIRISQLYFINILLDTWIGRQPNWPSILSMYVG